MSDITTKTPEQTLNDLDFGHVPSLSPLAVEEKLATATPDAPVTLTEEESEALYVEATELKVAKEAIDARLEEIKTAYRSLDYGKAVVHKGSGGSVSIGHNPVFNEARFLVEFPYDEALVEKVVETDEIGVDHIVEVISYPNRDYYKIAADRPAMKRIMTDETYKALFDEGMKKVTL